MRSSNADLLRHRQPRPVECRAATGRQQVDHRHLSRATRRPARRAGIYQFTPHDEHDYDGINEQILLDMPFGGKLRKVLVHPDRNGYIYVIDRTTGQVLSADPFGPVNSSKGVDLKTGRLIRQSGQGDEDSASRCPTSAPPPRERRTGIRSSFSPQTGLIYIPHENMCMDWMNMQVNYIAGTPYVGAEVHMKPGPGGNRGELTAWDPVRAASRCGSSRKTFRSGPARSSPRATWCSTARWTAGSKRSTRVPASSLWRFKVDSGIIGQPVSYRGPDGHQYIAVLSGVGGWSGAVVSGPVDPRDGSAALGMINVMSDLPKYTTAGGTLYVFCASALKQPPCCRCLLAGCSKAAPASLPAQQPAAPGGDRLGARSRRRSHRCRPPIRTGRGVLRQRRRRA